MQLIATYSINSYAQDYSLKEAQFLRFFLLLKDLLAD